ncbi:hypothetical protein [Streptomyces sp. NPDC048385]|uniref:hypothetical protein n=1 Tax=Streptomyces sp. NPDC048385 TaxID=3155145 RepID=UPI003445DA33
MNGVIVILLLVLAFFGGRAWQWRRDRVAVRFSAQASELYATITDIAEYKRRAQREIDRLTKR